MNLLIAIALTLVLVGAALVVFTDRPSRQAVLLGVYGLLLTIVFMTLAAPDVALSQLAIGTAVVPLIVALSIRKIAGVRAARRAGNDHGDDTEDHPEAGGRGEADNAGGSAGEDGS